MAHHKRRKRKAVKGHCWLCSLRKTNGTRQGRKLTIKEKLAKEDTERQIDADRA